MDSLAVTPVLQDAAKSVQEKQLLLSQLLGRVAPEIRTPLSSLAIRTELLEEVVARKPADVRARSVARFRKIRTEIERLSNLVAQFLSPPLETAKRSHG
jgi:signal transduction histidine kinase